MNLTKYLVAESVLLGREALDKTALLKQLCASLRASPALRGEPPEHLQEVEDAVFAREEQMPTGLGGGFAFPHARLKFLRRPAVALAVLRCPVDFGAPDGVAANIVCLVIAPESNPTVALKIMSQCCRSFADENLRKGLEAAVEPAQVMRLLEQVALPLDVAITARDIMREPLIEVHPDTPLRRVTAVMSKHHLNAVAVVSQEREVVGHITCARLFNFGLPDFFSQLKSVSFISEFDPFEKYFFEEAHSRASDLMTTDFLAVPPSATLLEIVFALTTLRQPMLYVVENGRLCGVIDQSSVLDQIINF